MPNTVFWVGHAKLPEGMPAKNMFDTMGLALEIDCKYFVVVRASCTLATAHGQEFIENLLIGCSLLDGVEPLMDSIDAHYMGKGKRAIFSCLKDIGKQFNERQRSDRAACPEDSSDISE